MKTFVIVLLTVSFIWTACSGSSQNAKSMKNSELASDSAAGKKLIIYQMMVRLFGNKNNNNKYYGSLEENGTGKFEDITVKALQELKNLGISHVWYTGVLEHATMTDYSSFGIKADDPDIVKGRAGSPYAIKDYYDVDPDLAVDVRNRMAEFESLVQRTHQQGLKLIIDFVPNHVARTYNSDARPEGVVDFGEKDDKTRAFDVKNDFYYIPGKAFVVPKGTNPGGEGFTSRRKDGKFDENPAKATGNNVFLAAPKLDDWFETIKLNYGVDYQKGEKKHFNPVPPVWAKMRDILLFWAAKDVDGFRCDVAEMVPVEFWSWVIPQIKKVKPKIIFIAEAYNPNVYKQYLTVGKFDYLYDKVGLYDAVKKLIKNDRHADVKDISRVCNQESRDFPDNMLRFLENHDEERIASAAFAGDPWYAVPGMVLSATLSGGPVMIYFGQEVGEPGKGKEGFGGEDNRTTIFDYWGVPEHQKWMNGGAFDGALLSEDQKKLRVFYSRLLNLAARQEALTSGKFYELGTNQKGFSKRMYAFVRFTEAERLVVIVNFERKKGLKTNIVIPSDLLSQLKLAGESAVRVIDLLNGRSASVAKVADGIPVNVPPRGAAILKLE